MEGWQVAAKGLGPLPRRRGSALSHGWLWQEWPWGAAAGEGGRRVNRLEGTFATPEEPASLSSLAAEGNSGSKHRSSSAPWLGLGWGLGLGLWLGLGARVRIGVRG